MFIAGLWKPRLISVFSRAAGGKHISKKNVFQNFACIKSIQTHQLLHLFENGIWAFLYLYRNFIYPKPHAVNAKMIFFARQSP
jgi:hypothetical protein